MPLSAGKRLGPYEILAPLGAGGMGEVYRARDAKLNRDVALKILPDTFAADVDRISRFRREAQVLASLNHPNIGQIYGLEDTTAPHALVLELIEGPTLADRIAQGPIPLAEALPIARQVAEALEAAHELGVVHRDLKPANIKVRADDTVKVLDFGLAKALDPVAASSDALNSPTLTVRATQLGLVLGTAAYMSPEQAKGKAVDRRADIWAFGAVLYEMLSGKRPFEGDDVSDTLAAVLRQEVKWNALPASTPPAVIRLLMRCLERDVRKRLRDIGEARILLEDPSTSAAEPPRETPAQIDRPQPVWKRAAPIVGTAIIIGLLAGSAGWYFRPSPASGVVTRFRHSLPDGVTFSAPTRHVLNISRDGTQIVYVANDRLYIRKISESEGQPVQGSDGFGPLTQPAFSPDGRSVAFWAASDSTIKRIPATGGPAVTVCQSDNPHGVSWDESGIIFGQGDKGTIMRASANGGTPETLVTARTSEMPSGPQILPDGKHLLFAVTTETSLDRWDKAQIVVQSLTSAERKTIIAAGADARYLPTGHITYAVAGVLFIVPFDLSRLQTTGSSIPVVEGVLRGVPTSATGSAQYAISNSGTLAYVPGPVSPGSGALDIALIDRQGTVNALRLPAGSYASPRVSPDGATIAFDVDAGLGTFIATYDLAGKTAMRPLTIGGTNRYPVWTPDSTRIAYQSDREGDRGLFWQRADGNGPVERLTRADGGEEHLPESWSPGSNVLLVTIRKGSEFTLWSLSLPDKRLARFGSIRATGMPLNAAFSPDGRWVAYQSNVEGRITVYVQPMPPTGAVYRLLPRGADVPHEPQWSPDGKELFYNPRAGGFEVVSVTAAPAFAFGNPVALPRPFQMSPPQARRSYDVTPNGMTVARILPGRDLVATRIEVVLNWFDEVKRHSDLRPR